MKIEPIFMTCRLESDTLMNFKSFQQRVRKLTADGI